MEFSEFIPLLSLASLLICSGMNYLVGTTKSSHTGINAWPAVWMCCVAPHYCTVVKDYVRIGNVSCTQYDGQSMTNTLQNDHHKRTEAISTRSC